MSSSLYPHQQLKRRTMAWALKLGVNPAQVMFADMPDKWGSCSSDGLVTFADDIVEMEPEFQDYVIVHELLHLRYRDHSRRFKAMMNAMVPRWRELERRGRNAAGSRVGWSGPGFVDNHGASLPPTVWRLHYVDPTRAQTGQGADLLPAAPAQASGVE